MKYKNKDGISLNYTGNDIHSHLVREVISEAIKIIRTGDIDSGVNFLIENFELDILKPGDRPKPPQNKDELDNYLKERGYGR
tara:strand:+ start:474 stop:719 length:246 start_codon:yes stop_codon:yes gene_type:complete